MSLVAVVTPSLTESLRSSRDIAHAVDSWNKKTKAKLRHSYVAKTKRLRDFASIVTLPVRYATLRCDMAQYNVVFLGLILNTCLQQNNCNEVRVRASAVEADGVWSTLRTLARVFIVDFRQPSSRDGVHYEFQ